MSNVSVYTSQGDEELTGNAMGDELRGGVRREGKGRDGE
jgi:hypothetical protein